MNNKEILLAIQMLSDYSDSLGDNSCNDFEFPEDWSEIEKSQFTLEYHIDNGDIEEFAVGDIINSDFCVAGLLSEKLKGLLK